MKRYQYVDAQNIAKIKFWYKNSVFNRYPWTQTMEENGDTFSADDDVVWKKSKRNFYREVYCYQFLSKLKMPVEPCVQIPKFLGLAVLTDGEIPSQYLGMENVLQGFSYPHVMKIKMGMRSFLISEADVHLPDSRREIVRKLKIRQNKENPLMGKLGFEIQGRTKGEALQRKDSPISRDDIKAIFKKFFFRRNVVNTIELLKNFDKCFNDMDSWFAHTELIGTSLLFVQCSKSNKFGIYMIDFEQTAFRGLFSPTDHLKAWSVHNREDGYRIGLRNLIAISAEILRE